MEVIPLETRAGTRTLARPTVSSILQKFKVATES